jgi:hypothetical protein
MKHAIVAVALTDREVSADVPAPGQVCGVYFVPNPAKVKAPNAPPDMPVLFVDVDLDAPKRSRRFIVLRNGEQVDDTSDRPIIDGNGGMVDLVDEQMRLTMGLGVSAPTSDVAPLSPFAFSRTRTRVIDPKPEGES